MIVYSDNTVTIKFKPKSKSMALGSGFRQKQFSNRLKMHAENILNDLDVQILKITALGLDEEILISNIYNNRDMNNT